MGNTKYTFIVLAILFLIMVCFNAMQYFNCRQCFCKTHHSKNLNRLK